MKVSKIALLPGLCVLLIQVFPVDRRLPATKPELALEQQYMPPANVVQLLKNACYDCHSNQTRYPWYSRIQPIGWWIQQHIREGRNNLNFSDIGNWTSEDQADLLRHSAKLVHQEEMPLASYLPLHPEARLRPEEKKLLVDWLMQQADRSYSPTRVPSDTCDDNDAHPRCCFAQMPKQISATLQLASEQEPGPRIQITGQFLKKDGKTPYPNVLVYAYQTDRTGRYTTTGSETGILRWHGRLHAWGRTDAEGRYAIRSVKPAAYPGRSAPAHIHMVVWEPGAAQEPYYIDDFLFADDPLLNGAAKHEPEKSGRRSAVLVLKENPGGYMEGWRDIVLTGK